MQKTNMNVSHHHQCIPQCKMHYARMQLHPVSILSTCRSAGCATMQLHLHPGCTDDNLIDIDSLNSSSKVRFGSCSTNMYVSYHQQCIPQCRVNHVCQDAIASSMLPQIMLQCRICQDAIASASRMHG